MSFQSQGGNQNTTYKTEYFLIDPADSTILYISDTPSFVNVTSGIYEIYAINYNTQFRITGLTVNSTIDNIKSLCPPDMSGPLSLSVCSKPEITTSQTDTIDYCLGNPLPIFSSDINIDEPDGDSLEIHVSIITNGDSQMDSLNLDSQAFSNTITLFSYPNLIIRASDLSVSGIDIASAESIISSIILKTQSASLAPRTISARVVDASGNYSNSIEVVLLVRDCTDNCPAPSITTITEALCAGGVYDFNGTILSESGLYTDTLKNIIGCDSIVELNLQIRDEISSSFDINLCAGEAFDYKNNSYTNSQNISDVLTSSTGCDSTVVFNLNIDVAQTVDVDVSLCVGDSVLVGSNYIKSDGVYSSLLSNALGCLDSTVMYFITVYPAIAMDRNVELCAGDSILIGGAYRHSSGSYDEVYQSSLTGCDSIITTQLIVEDVIELWAEDINICQGESFDIIVSGAENLIWSSSNLLSCNNCPNPMGTVDETTTFTATTDGCAGQEVSIDITVTVFNEVQIEATTPDTSLTLGSSIVLDAWITDPFTEISWYDESGKVICSNCSRVEVTPIVSTLYYAEAISDSGCTVRDTVRTYINDACSEGSVIVPNFISPNGDGINDDLRVRYDAIESIKNMRIFNRWGQLVFQTDDIDNVRWDGTIQGVLANSGVYIYFIEYQCLNGDDFFLKGSITLLK